MTMPEAWGIAVVLTLTAWPAHSQEMPPSRRDTVSVEHLTLEACVNRFTPSRVESTKAGFQYWFIDRNFLDGRTVKMSAVKPGFATHPPHRHPEDEIFFVLEGIAEVFLNGDRTTVRPYATFYCPPNSEHGIRNAGDGELKYLVIKKYGKD